MYIYLVARAPDILELVRDGRLTPRDGAVLLEIRRDLKRARAKRNALVSAAVVMLIVAALFVFVVYAYFAYFLVRAQF